MLPLIQYILAIVIVILFLVGSTLLSLRLRIREEIDQQPEEEVQLAITDDQLRRRVFRTWKSNYTRVF
jgi:hypothetical protein